jgi:DNA-directed RNA polymerase II subunit RPB1
MVYITRYEISLLKDKEIEDRASIQITKTDIVNNNQPAEHGCVDLHMGSTSYENPCYSCGKFKKDCLGHPGYINLNSEKIVLPYAIEIVKKYLGIICFNCGHCLVEPPQPTLNLTKAKLTQMQSKGTIYCQNCKTEHIPLINSEDVFDICRYSNESKSTERKQGKKTNKKVKIANSDKTIVHYTMKEIYTILQRVDMAVVREMHEHIHPAELLYSNIVALPNTFRLEQANYTGSAVKNHHDVTTQYSAIIRCKTSNTARELSAIQILVNTSMMGTTFSNSKTSITANSKEIQCGLSTLATKYGIIRNKELGGRTVNAARATIAGDCNVNLGSLSVSQYVAKRLQKSEMVTAYNFDRMVAIFTNRNTGYPGCTVKIDGITGQKYNVAVLPSNAKLNIGDILERDHMEGEAVAYNRAPTLQASGIGNHVLQISDDPTQAVIIMNPSVCKNYDADFDGDTMTIFANPSIGASIESRILLNLDNSLIKAKNSSILNCEIEDTVVGCAKLSLDKTKYKKHTVMRLFRFSNCPDFSKYPKDYEFGGREIISMLFEKIPFDYRRKPNCAHDNFIQFMDVGETLEVIIENGVFKSGVIDNESIGSVNGSIFHVIANKYDKNTAMKLIEDMQYTINSYLMHASGISITSFDIIPTKEAMRLNNLLIQDALNKHDNNYKKLLKRGINPPVGRTLYDHFELLTLETLKISDKTSMLNVFKDKYIDNNYVGMVKFGSKGKIQNLTNVSGCIGQVTIATRRLNQSYSAGRASPYFPRFSGDPEPRGFIKNSYVSGMTSSQHIAASCSGRADLLARALDTAISGDFTRKGVYAVQSNVVNNFRSVVVNKTMRNLLYGSTGFSPSETCSCTYKPYKMNEIDLSKMIGPVSGPNCTKLAALIIADRLKFIEIMDKMIKSNVSAHLESILQIPIDAELLTGVYKTALPDNESLQEIKAKMVLDFCERLPYVYMNEECEANNVNIPTHYKMGMYKQIINVRLAFMPSKLRCINIPVIEGMFKLIKHKIIISFIPYGQAVGVLAAQSISQPLTQYMLDSHHRSVSGGTSSQGIDHIKEVFNAKESDYTGRMQLFPTSPNGVTKLEMIQLNQFIVRRYMLFEPKEVSYPEFVSDGAWIKTYLSLSPEKAKADVSNWCMRIVLDKSKIVYKHVLLSNIITKLESTFENLLIVTTPEVSKELVMRIWIKHSKVKEYKRKDAIKIFEEVFKYPVRGINHIYECKTETLKSIRSNATVEETEKIVTQGSNLFECMLLKGFDHNYTLTSSVSATYKMFGISAARDAFINETKVILEQFLPSTVHIMLFADELMSTGAPTSIERPGITEREPSNILLQMASGSPVQKVTGAALKKISSNVYGLAASHLVGGIPNVGTNYCKVFVNEEFILSHKNKNKNKKT